MEGHRSPDDAAEQAYQKGELERSIAFCKGTLGLGEKAWGRIGSPRVDSEFTRLDFLKIRNPDFEC